MYFYRLSISRVRKKKPHKTHLEQVSSTVYYVDYSKLHGF